MEFWDNLSKTVSDAADYTVKEAGKLTGIAKLKYKISTVRARLDTMYVKIGRLKYSESKGTADDSGCSYNELFETIDSLEAELVGYENELAKLKNERLCIACRSVIGLDMSFCPRCGAKQPEVTQEEEPVDNCDCNCDCNSDCSCDCGDEIFNDGCDESCDCGCKSESSEDNDKSCNCGEE